jgi:hypothetical protein
MDKKQELTLVAIGNFFAGMYTHFSGLGWFFIDRPRTAVLNILLYWALMVIEPFLIIAAIMIWLLLMFGSIALLTYIDERFVFLTSILYFAFFFIVFFLAICLMLVNLLVNALSSYLIYKEGMKSYRSS